MIHEIAPHRYDNAFLQSAPGEGDAALYCVEGPVTVNLVDLEESFVLEPEDTFFIPSGVKYQLVNFENHPVKTVFAITKL